MMAVRVREPQRCSGPCPSHTASRQRPGVLPVPSSTTCVLNYCVTPPSPPAPETIRAPAISGSVPRSPGTRLVCTPFSSQDAPWCTVAISVTFPELREIWLSALLVILCPDSVWETSVSRMPLGPLEVVSEAPPHSQANFSQQCGCL